MHASVHVTGPGQDAHMYTDASTYMKVYTIYMCYPYTHLLISLPIHSCVSWGGAASAPQPETGHLLRLTSPPSTLRRGSRLLLCHSARETSL